MTPALNNPMTALHEYSKYPWRHFMNIQNTHDVSFVIFKIPMTLAWIFIKLPLTSPHEYSNYPWGHFMNNHDIFVSIQKTNYITSWSFKIPMASAFEYSNYSWGILNIHEVTSLVFWIFTKWRHGNIQNLTSWVFWIFKSVILDILNIQSDIGILNILEVMSWVLWIFKRSRVILNMNFKIPMTSASEYFHNVTSLFKIPMTSPHKYSKYP